MIYKKYKELIETKTENRYGCASISSINMSRNYITVICEFRKYGQFEFIFNQKDELIKKRITDYACDN